MLWRKKTLRMWIPANLMGNTTLGEIQELGDVFLNLTEERPMFKYDLRDLNDSGRIVACSHMTEIRAQSLNDRYIERKQNLRWILSGDETPTLRIRTPILPKTKIKIAR